MGCDNTIHVPIFSLSENGDLSVYIAFQNQDIPARTIWILEETSKEEIKFVQCTNGASCITRTNITKGIPCYLNVVCEGKMCQFYLEECHLNNDIKSITYRNEVAPSGKAQKSTGHRNDYIFYIFDEPSTKLAKLGLYANIEEVPKVYLWKPPSQEFQCSRSIELKSTDISREGETRFESYCPPLLIFCGKALQTFTFSKIIHDTQTILYDELWYDDREDYKCFHQLKLLLNTPHAQKDDSIL